MTEYIQVIITIDSREGAERIARALVERRLAACVQALGPIASTYWWEGKIETAQEYLCLIKSRAELYDQLEHAIREIHSYSTPEIIATPIVNGHRDYLSWLARETEQQE